MGITYEVEEKEMSPEETIVYVQDWIQGYIDKLEFTDSGCLEEKERYAIAFSVELLTMMKADALSIQYAKAILRNMAVRVDH